MRELRLHVISLPKLDDGIYKTAWRALSEDGHAIKGEFMFEVSPKGIDTLGADVKLLNGEGEVKRIRGTKITIKHIYKAVLSPPPLFTPPSCFCWSRRSTD